MIKNINFLLQLTITTNNNNKQLINTTQTTKTTYHFTQLTLKNYKLTIQTINT
ncbi:phage tail tip protein J-related protein [Klebsiella pneumoniae]|uniref:phage tail tip protein J-related protein n=1 Tax=Klebsiella pneumoniae TaxID=573 RepID=UPI003B5C4EEF